MPKRTHAYHLAATRARQAQREREAELERRQHRRQTLRRGFPVLGLLAAALVALGIVWLVSGSSWPVAASTAVTTATTSIKTTGYTTSADCTRGPATKLVKPLFKTEPRPSINITKTYTAVIETDLGPILVDLDAKAAPYNVNNFVYLAENGYYDCQSFSAAGVGYLIEAGGQPTTPTVSSQQGPTYRVRTENVPARGTKYHQWSVVLVNGGGGASGAALAIIEGPVGEAITARDPVIGTVVSGTTVVADIAGSGGTAANEYHPKVVHRIESVTVNEVAGR